MLHLARAMVPAIGLLLRPTPAQDPPDVLEGNDVVDGPVAFRDCPVARSSSAPCGRVWEERAALSEPELRVDRSCGELGVRRPDGPPRRERQRLLLCATRFLAPKSANWCRRPQAIGIPPYTR